MTKESVRARLDRIEKALFDPMSKPMICLYTMPDGEQRKGTVFQMIADNGEFVRGLNGSGMGGIDECLDWIISRPPYKGS